MVSYVCRDPGSSFVGVPNGAHLFISQGNHSNFAFLPSSIIISTLARVFYADRPTTASCCKGGVVVGGGRQRGFCVGSWYVKQSQKIIAPKDRTMIMIGVQQLRLIVCRLLLKYGRNKPTRFVSHHKHSQQMI